MAVDTLAAALSNIQNADKIGKRECIVRPNSKLLRKVLDIMKENEYIGGYEPVEDTKGGFLKIKLRGAINKCGVVKPRFSVKNDGYVKFEKRYLPALNIGLLIVSTPKGIMVHQEAKINKIGGKLIAFVY